MSNNVKGRSILYISIDFPPARTSGIYRPVFWSKYLIEAGWKMTLLTAASHLSPIRDESLDKEIHPELEIIRVSAPMPRKLTHNLFEKYKETETKFEGSSKRSFQTAVLKSLKKYLLSPVFRLINNFILIPDNYIIWCIKCFPKALRLIRSKKITHLIVTAPPPSVLLLGLMLKYLTRVIFITDFRNSWTDNRPYEFRLRASIERFWEKKVLKNSHAIINMSPGDIGRLLGRLPDVDQSKLFVVTNGYNENDWTNLPSQSKERQGTALKLLYVGSMYDHSGDSTAEALHHLQNQGISSSELELTIIGFSDVYFDQLVLKHNLEGLVKNQGFMKHDDLLKAYFDFDIMYLLTGGNPYYHVGALPGKIFEYMRLGKPILHAGIEGTTHDILSQSGLEIFVDLDDPIKIADTMLELIEKKKQSNLQMIPNRTLSESYEWKRLTQKVSEILTEIGDDAR